MRTAIYIRVSTEEQAKEGYSISAQRRRLQSFCISQDWQISDFYIDEGISAKNTNRINLKRMIKDIKDDKIDCVLVYRLDRLTRSVFDLYKLLETFDKHNCKFKSATEVYDTTTAMGRMFITIVAALAQWERENLGERISLGFAEKARQGKYPLNFRPFGYDLNLKESKLYINEKEATTVRLIYNLYTDGHSGPQVCTYLNNRNITTRDGNKWNDKPVMDILKNPLYIGSFRWQDFIVEDTHDSIITKGQFELVQKIISSRRTTEPRRVSSRYIFSGKIKCKNCGDSLVGYFTSYNSKKYMNYRCGRKRTGQCIGSKTVSETKLEEAFLDNIEQFDYEESFRQASEKCVKILNNTHEVDIRALEKELEKVERRKKNWQYAWSDEIMTYQDFKERMNEANKEEEKIKKLIKSTINNTENEKINKEEIMQVLMEIRKNWYFLEGAEKKNLVNSIVEEIHFSYMDKRLTIDNIDFI
ncbi:recombinase family protein [Bacillus sp. FJAT-49732]|uniref:Recombinase family protein n=1 Tax=Lederbergia citrisecunda TaxID=2833583 RepID=A0A942TI99_9BACI|nr:recombinase family protein [Lederbergia citrisecunda]MBS4198581.1 recombinase family protein [Lederbergia citrisecunda]